MGDFFQVDCPYFCLVRYDSNNMQRIAEIKVQGQLDKNWTNFFDGMEIDYNDGNTVFYGDFKDQSFVHGILNRIRDLNLKLISVNIIEKHH